MSKSLADDDLYPPTILGIGTTGSGKSTFFYRFPKAYVINADINMGGPRKQFKKENHPLDVKFDYVHLDDNDKPIEILKRFERFTQLLSKAVADSTIETIILDSITKLVEVFKAEVCRQMNLPYGTPFEFKHWGKLLFLFTSIFDKLRCCGKTVIVIGHFDTEKDKIDDIMRFVLGVPGQSQMLVPVFATDMWWFSAETVIGNNNQPTGKYTIRTIQDERHPNIKSSLDLPAKFEATQEMADKIIAQIKPTK